MTKTRGMHPVKHTAAPAQLCYLMACVTALGCSGNFPDQAPAHVVPGQTSASKTAEMESRAAGNSAQRADELLSAGDALAQSGDYAAAIERYGEAVAAAPERAAPLPDRPAVAPAQ